MPVDLRSDAVLITTSGLLVAAGAVPVGLLARAFRPASEPLLPRYIPWRVPWSGFEILLAFLAVVYVLPALVYAALEWTGFFLALYGPNFPPAGPAGANPEAQVATTLRGLWVSAFAFPFQFGAIALAIGLLHPRQPMILGQGSTAGKVQLAIVSWQVVTPVVLALNVAVNLLASAMGTEPQSHPLTKLAGVGTRDLALFVSEACIGAPFREEVLIRGALLAWCVGRTRLFGPGVDGPTAARPCFVMSVAVAFTFFRPSSGPMLFAAVLVIGLAVVWRLVHTGARRTRAVYATAALFALMHPTWPNPVPLFALGLGLGWLALRTSGVLVPILVHSLFNAVSVVYSLRGGG